MRKRASVVDQLVAGLTDAQRKTMGLGAVGRDRRKSAGDLASMARGRCVAAGGGVTPRHRVTRSGYDFSFPAAGFGVGGVDRPATVSHVQAQRAEEAQAGGRGRTASRAVSYLSELARAPQRRGAAGRASMPARAYHQK